MSSIDFVPTKASVKKQAPLETYQEVTYVAYKSQQKDRGQKAKADDVKSENAGFNIKKVKQEVLKLGMSGFDPTKKEEAKIQQLIKLGAKPPKNKYKNYKALVNEKRIEKVKEAKEQKFKQLGKNKAGKSTAKGKSFDKKRRKEGILDIYGKIVRDKAKTVRNRK